MLIPDDELIRHKTGAGFLMALKSSPARPSVNAARLCKVLQPAEFKVTFTECGGRYSQLFHSFCGKRKGAIKLAEGEDLEVSRQAGFWLDPSAEKRT